MMYQEFRVCWTDVGGCYSHVFDSFQEAIDLAKRVYHPNLKSLNIETTPKYKHDERMIKGGAVRFGAGKYRGGDK